MYFVNYFGEYWGYITLFSLSAISIMVSVLIFYFQFKTKLAVAPTTIGQAS
jgi:hypothetical protein